MEGMKNAKPHIFSSASYVACLLLGNYSCATTEKQHRMLQIKAGPSSGPEPYIVKPVSVNRTSNNIKKMEEECTVDCVSDFCQLDRFFYSNGRLELSGFGLYIQYFGQVTKHQKPLLNFEAIVEITAVTVSLITSCGQLHNNLKLPQLLAWAWCHSHLNQN